MTIKGVACLLVKYDPSVDVYPISNINYSTPHGDEIFVEWIDDLAVERSNVLAKNVDYSFTAGAIRPNESFTPYNNLTITFTQNFINSVLKAVNPYFKVYRKTAITQEVHYSQIHSNLQQSLEFSFDKLTKIIQELVCVDQEILRVVPNVLNIQVDVAKLKVDNVKNIADILKLTNDVNGLITSLTILTNSVTGNITSINTLNNLTNALRTELDALKLLLPTPSKTGLTLISYEDPNNSGTYLARWETPPKSLPDTTGAKSGQVLAVDDPATNTYHLVNATALPDAVGSSVGSVPMVSDTTAGSYALTSIVRLLTALLRQAKGGDITNPIAEGQYIINVSDTEVVSLITDPLPSGTFAEQGNSVVLTSAPKGYSLKKIVGLPDPSSAQSGQAVTLVDPQQGTYQYSDVIYGTTSGATKNSVLVIDDETFATTVFLSPANFIEGQLRTVLGTADADNVPAGDYVITIKADGTATYSLYTGGAEDIDQNTGIVSGLHLVSTGVDLSKIRIEPGVAQFVANVEGRPNAKTIFYELKTAIDLAVPTVPKEYFIYINSTGVASTKEVNMASPRGNELCIGSVRVDKDNGIVRIAQARRKVDSTSANLYEFYQNLWLTSPLSGGNLALNPNSPTNQIKIVGGKFVRDGGYPVPDSFFKTPLSSRDVIKYRFLTNNDYSGVFSEFPKNPPTLVSGVVADLPAGRWGYYLLFVDVRHDPEVTQVADTTKIDTGCSITVLPAFQTSATKPTGITSTLFSTYYNANSGKIPQELDRYGRVFGLLIYKGNSDLNNADNTLANVFLTSGANTSTGTNLPSGTTTDVGKVLRLIKEPDTYGYVDIISDTVSLNTSLISGCAVTKVGTTGLNVSVSAGKVLFVSPETAGLSTARTIVDIALQSSIAIPPLEGISYVVAKKDKTVVIETTEPLGTRGDKCLLAIVQHSANDILNVMNVADKGDSVVGQLREMKNAIEPNLRGCNITITGKSFNIAKGSYFGRGIEADTVNPDDGVVISASTGAKFVFFDQDGKPKTTLTEFPDTAIVELTKGTLTPEVAGKWYYYPMFISPSGELHIQYAVKEYDTKILVPRTRKFLDEYLPTVPSIYKRYFAFRGILLKEGGQPISISNMASNYSSYIEDLNANSSSSSSNPVIPVPTVADAGKILTVNPKGNYILFQTLESIPVPPSVVSEGAGLVTTRSSATETNNLASGQDLFNRNTARGKFVTPNLTNLILDGTLFGLDHFSSDFVNGIGKMAIKNIGNTNFELPPNPSPNVWYTAEGLFTEVLNSPFYAGGSYDQIYGFSTRNHSVSPIVIRPTFNITPPSSLGLFSTFGIAYTPRGDKGEILTITMDVKKLPDYANLTLPSGDFTLDRHDITLEINAGQKKMNNRLIMWFYRDYISGAVILNGQGVGTEISVKGLTPQNAKQKFADFLTDNPFFFLGDTDPIDSSMDITVSMISTLVARHRVSFEQKILGFSSTDLVVEFQIMTNASYPKDHRVYEMGTLKSWLADATAVTNSNLTITAGKKLVATLSQIKAYTGTDSGFIFDPSKYGANTLPTLNLETTDKSEIVRFVPRALSTSDIVYISETEITQDMIDNYIIRVRIKSISADPLIANLPNLNMKLSFVDADKF